MRSIYLRRHEPMKNIDDKNMEKGTGTFTVANFVPFLQNSSSKHIGSMPKLICN
jgi:hypothetical protein